MAPSFTPPGLQGSQPLVFCQCSELPVSRDFLSGEAPTGQSTAYVMCRC